MSGVFINYRAIDDPLGAAAIHAVLARKFGADQVFRDCISMKPGEHYPRALRAALERVDVLVAVIGPRWLTLTDGHGQRRIDQEEDWVRLEIDRALQRGIHLIPVILKDTPHDARMPQPHELPESIRPLAYLQKIDLSQRRFDADVAALTDRIAELTPTIDRGRLARRRRWRALAYALLTGVAIAATIMPFTPASQPSPIVQGRELTLLKGQGIDLHAKEWDPKPGCGFTSCDVWVTGTGIYGHANRTAYSLLSPSTSNTPSPSAAYNSCLSAERWMNYVPRGLLLANTRICVKSEDGAYALLTVISTDPIQSTPADVQSATFRVTAWHP